MAPGKVVQHSIPIDILDDLSSRFIINVPEESRTDLVRICFQVELAHWFYIDFYCRDDSPNVIRCGMKEFAAHIFQHIPFLQRHSPHLESILDNWREYKQAVPTFGAVLLNEELTHVLLVQSYWARASWGFPKGKVNEQEEPWHCACREVLEETGFDITNLINKNDFIESTIHDQIVRLYIIGYVPQSTVFKPRTRNEIKACEWFPLADLPSNRKDMTPKVKMGVNPNAFFMVLPFVKRLKRWVAEKSQSGSNSKRLRHKSMGDLDMPTSKGKTKAVSHGLQKEIMEYQQNNPFKARGNSITPKNVGQGKKDKKNNFKRQLFTAGNFNQQIPKPTAKVPEVLCNFNDFIVKSWMDFKFDRTAIWDAMT